MNGGLIASVYTLAVSVIVAAVSYWFTKTEDQDADLRKLRFDFYREFVVAFAQMTDEHATEVERIRFNTATNAMYLAGTPEVLKALSDFRKAIGYRNELVGEQKQEQFIEKYTKLLWVIRKDLKLPTVGDSTAFRAEYWAASPPKSEE